jgi:o-succinylbenzoate---CoA ligase
MLIGDQISWDFPIFEGYVEEMCKQIKSFPYDHVAFLALPTPEVILSFFATWKLGKIACPINFRLPTPPVFELKTKLFTPQMPDKPASSTSKFSFLECDKEKTAVILFTSGSTGKPKSAKLSFNNILKSAEGSNQIIPLHEKDLWALSLPLFHVGGIGILVRSYLAKSSILLSHDWNLATHLSLVSTQLYDLIQQKKNLPNIKKILIGGSPIPKIETPWDVITSYGMTEMSSQIVTANRLHPYAKMQIAHDNEIWVKGDVLFQGYLDHPPHNPDDWFPTGDLGQWNAHGEFCIMGRKDNMFISGGENIQPEEIEEYIREKCNIHPAIIIPIKHERFGKVPAVFLKDPSTLSKIQDILKNHLPKYKIPIRALLLPKISGLKYNRKYLELSIINQKRKTSPLN